ncbi:MAG: hypothetical protein HQ472_07105 [Ignavibacteria bacterium]|nr:hypothetical protein [Ignavibacteria bacterium]
MKFFRRVAAVFFVGILCSCFSKVCAQEAQTVGKTFSPAPASEKMEDKRVMSVGVLGMYNISVHSATALKLPGIPSCCPGYEGASGGGFAGGLELSLPIGSGLEFISRLMYQSSSGEMTFNEPVTVRINNQAVPTFFTHNLTSSLTFFMLEPGVEYAITEGFRAVGGLRIGALASSTYTQKETLDPSIPYDYSDGSGVRNDTKGDITGTSAFQFGFFAGVNYHLPMNSKKTLELVPEIQIAPLFTSVMSDATWSVMSVRFGIGIVYNIVKSAKVSNPLKP